MDTTTQSKVQAWLDGPYDADTKATIQHLLDTGAETELTDSFYRNLEFGTGGLRGVMGVGSNRINKYTIGMATQGLANYLKQQFPNQQVSVAIAHDSRNNSDKFAGIVADVFSANAIKVYFFTALRPTPLLSFAIRHYGCQSGVVLTASHNPKEYNGYKAYWTDGAQMVAPHDTNVINEVEAVKIEDVQWTRNEQLVQHVTTEVDEAYFDKMVTLSVDPEVIKRQQDLKIVYTPIHGTGITVVPELLKRFGFKNVHVVESQSTPDGNFPTVVYPNPEESEALSIALEEAKSIDADLLLGTDPDADRVGIAAKNHHGDWQLLNGNQTATLLVYYMLNSWKAAGKFTGKEMVIKTIVTTDIISKMAADYGVDCPETLTGFKYIAAVIAAQEGKKTFIVGGEESYGYLVGDYVRDKDAVISCALIAEMVAAAKDKGLSLFDQLIEIYQKYGFYKEGLISLTKKGKAGAEEIQAMMAELRANPPKTINGSVVTHLLDYKSGKSKDLATGLESDLDLDSSNVLQFLTADGSKISARPSGTEPKIKFYFGVVEPLNSPGDFDKVSAELDTKIKAIIADLKLT
jgi:phosphoglucomutase